MAKGTVNWTNPPENKGKIKRTDDGTNNEYEYNINAGDTVDGYIPKLGDPVIFIDNENPSRHATGVKKEVAAITCTLAVNLPTINLGDSVILSWASVNADTLTLNQGIGNVTPVERGSISHTPSSAGTIRYILTATNSAGESASASVDVNVT